ncbi:unnamed protein product [Camellia sinensis]
MIEFCTHRILHHMGIGNDPCFMFSILFLCWFSFITNHLSLGAVDTISATKSLSGDQTIVSAGGTFEMGFYKPGKSSNYYISMWYYEVSPKTIVWVANRDIPISNKYSSVLKILDGNLVLLNESQIIIWSTNHKSTTTTSSNSVAAVLGDDGNLVFRDGSNTNSTKPIWQSFDHPTHTWLPGSKFNTHQVLTSWKNSEDPSPGPFSLKLDATSIQFLLLWNGSEQYWISGPWNGKFFSLLPEMKGPYMYNYSYHDNKNESYFIYTPYNSSFICGFIMDASGQIKVVTWLKGTKERNELWTLPVQQCEVYGFCGAFGTCNENALPFCNCPNGFNPTSSNDWNSMSYSGGCMRRTELVCGNNKEKDMFSEYPNMRWPKHPRSVAVGSAEECKSTCLSNCSCTAYAYNSDGCSIWIGDLFNMQKLLENDDRGRTLYLRVAVSKYSGGKNKKGIICVVLGSVSVVLVFLGLIFAVRKRRQADDEQTTTVYGSVVAFRYKDVQKATKNFKEKMGGGGFGYVFKGKLPDSTTIAVKKLESVNQGEKQFRAEVSTLGTIQHVNLVRLRGFCSEGKKKLLVYEYMQNGSLDSHLFHEMASKVLDWKRRYQIALGTAKGLAYLHEECRDCIIHCDIKPENILLDVDFNPKVADFGLAKLLGREFSKVLTTMRGTAGYLAPEWILGVAITNKADVYSYGMMLFELISGRRNNYQSEAAKYFPIWVSHVVIEGGDVFRLLDSKLETHVDVEEVWRICKLACWCIQDDANHRPSMGDVVQVLEGILDVKPSPIPRLLQALVHDD